MSDATKAPERIWVAWPNPHGCGLAFTVPANPRLVQTGEGQLRSPYLLLTPAALAASPEVAQMLERAILDAQLRCLERGRIDTPDEIRAEAAALSGKETT